MATRPDEGGAEAVSCQFSVYPLRQPHIGGCIRDAVRAARAEGCTVRVGNLSTLMSGDEQQVFAALRAAFRAAQRHGPAVMTATLTTAAPSDDEVRKIQAEIEE